MDTIAAIATSLANSGIGIVRISGPKALEITNKVFIPKGKKTLASHAIVYGTIIEPKDNFKIDEVLVSYFKAPKSYTTEDVCEINSHGNQIVLKKILELLIASGARLAEPGEFTKRAFLNGRIDLVEAEGIIDLINSKTDNEAIASVKQLEGYLSNKINGIKSILLNALVDIEASIDYPEYDVPEVQINNLLNALNEAEEKIAILIKSFETGRILKQGICTVIVGKPNVGKSSFLNALLKEQRAIVTDVPGTTRDTIEEELNICGVPLRIIDTAGIRKTEDKVEKIGVDKAQELINVADLVLAIIDSSNELSNEDKEILEEIKNKKAIVILNKNDLENKINMENEVLTKVNKPIISLSALNQEGFDALEEIISKMFNLGELQIKDETVITNIRHKDLIEKALESLKMARDVINNQLPIDIIAINIKEILEALGQITGENATEEVINGIFAKFCLGK